MHIKCLPYDSTILQQLCCDSYKHKYRQQSLNSLSQFASLLSVHLHIALKHDLQKVHNFHRDPIAKIPSSGSITSPVPETRSIVVLSMTMSIASS